MLSIPFYQIVVMIAFHDKRGIGKLAAVSVSYTGCRARLITAVNTTLSLDRKAAPKTRLITVVNSKLSEHCLTRPRGGCRSRASPDWPTTIGQADYLTDQAACGAASKGLHNNAYY